MGQDQRLCARRWVSPGQRHSPISRASIIQPGITSSAGGAPLVQDAVWVAVKTGASLDWIYRGFEHTLPVQLAEKLPPLLTLMPADLILRKGVNPVVNGHWAFRENDKTTMTGLAGYLSERNVERIFLCGLPLDFCV